MRIRRVDCTVERINDTAVSSKAEIVINKLLRPPSPSCRPADGDLTKTVTVLLDDKKASHLARRWDSIGMPESRIVVPHLSYSALLTCFIRNLEIRAPDILGRLIVFLGYTEHGQVTEPDIISKSFRGERGEVLKYARRMGLSCIDPGHQLLVENQISLACYMIPARYLIFMDDDFFIENIDSMEKLVAPLKRGYILSGMYEKNMDKIHTCFFAMNPAYLRDELRLFDDGENLYYDRLRDTGTNTYRTLSKRDKGVFVLGESPDGNGVLGRHLGHCAAELWFDLPAILKKLFRLETISGDVCRMKLTVTTLLEALALLSKAGDSSDRYRPVHQDVRINAVNDFAAYFSEVYCNHRWLELQARACSPDLFRRKTDSGADGPISYSR